MLGKKLADAEKVFLKYMQKHNELTKLLDTNKNAVGKQFV